MQTNHDAQNQASYKRWTWIVALILAFILLWMLFTGRGPTNHCCSDSSAVAESTVTTPIQPDSARSESSEPLPNADVTEQPVITNDDQQMSTTAESSVAVASPPAAVKLYFDTGKTTLPDDANSNLAATIDWLKAHPEAKAVLSGYHDTSGNKAANEKLAKSRAESVEDALEAAGIDDGRIDKRKPESVDGGKDLAEARRVEVSIE